MSADVCRVFDLNAANGFRHMNSLEYDIIQC